MARAASYIISWVMAQRIFTRAVPISALTPIIDRPVKRTITKQASYLINTDQLEIGGFSDQLFFFYNFSTNNRSFYRFKKPSSLIYFRLTLSVKYEPTILKKGYFYLTYNLL